MKLTEFFHARRQEVCNKYMAAFLVLYLTNCVGGGVLYARFGPIEPGSMFGSAYAVFFLASIAVTMLPAVLYGQQKERRRGICNA